MRTPNPNEQKILAYMRENPSAKIREIADAIGVPFSTVANIRTKHGIKKGTFSNIDAAISHSHRLSDQKSETFALRDAVNEIARLRTEREAFFSLTELPPGFKIEPKYSSGTSEAIPVILASDWHYEERVRREEVNELNEFNLTIAKKRTTEFFQNSLRLIRIAEQDVKINTVVLALLGDFISGDIHEELLQTCELEPVDAIKEVSSVIRSGIDFLLDNSKASFVIPAKSGNHARTTKEQRFATEEGNSLEAYMYYHLQELYANEPRIKIITSKSYQIYIPMYDYMGRFHHGHSVKFSGGVGGITVPVNKAIAGWNTRIRADYDFFGHFHQRFDGGNFNCNGSLIGFGGYADRIPSVRFEKPSQTFCLIDKKRGKTIVAPILFSQ